MEQWGPRLRQVPIVMVLCGLVFGLWAGRLPDPSGVLCDRPQGLASDHRISPAPVYCQATLPRPWAWLPQSGQRFQLQEALLHK